MEDDHITTIGTCFACKRTFPYTAANVTMMTIDPETGLPPDRTVLGTQREPTPEALARSVPEPVCPDCLTRAREFKERMGSPAPFETWRRPGPN
ncbi:MULTISPECIES: hypothetical protein [unclassified Nonomuraea]|uniref:hypothetical protein n=1 Tax=unclassified Nonomuraea TaxID=2593643 RepID=UPI0033C54E63